MADSVVLEEELPENYEPTHDEILEYAKWLGMDPDTDSELFWIAREGLKAPLPENWKPCKTAEGEIYYFNFSSGDSVWDHPCDEYYRNLYAEEKKRHEEKKAEGAIKAKEKKEKKEKKKKKDKEAKSDSGSSSSKPAVAASSASEDLGPLKPKTSASKVAEVRTATKKQEEVVAAPIPITSNALAKKPLGVPAVTSSLSSSGDAGGHKREGSSSPVSDDGSSKGGRQSLRDLRRQKDTPSSTGVGKDGGGRFLGEDDDDSASRLSNSDDTAAMKERLARERERAEAEVNDVAQRSLQEHLSTLRKKLSMEREEAIQEFERDKAATLKKEREAREKELEMLQEDIRKSIDAAKARAEDRRKTALEEEEAKVEAEVRRKLADVEASAKEKEASLRTSLEEETLRVSMEIREKKRELEREREIEYQRLEEEENTARDAMMKEKKERLDKLRAEAAEVGGAEAAEIDKEANDLAALREQIKKERAEAEKELAELRARVSAEKEKLDDEIAEAKRSAAREIALAEEEEDSAVKRRAVAVTDSTHREHSATVALDAEGERAREAHRAELAKLDAEIASRRDEHRRTLRELDEKEDELRRKQAAQRTAMAESQGTSAEFALATDAAQRAATARSSALVAEFEQKHEELRDRLARELKEYTSQCERDAEKDKEEARKRVAAAVSAAKDEAAAAEAAAAGGRAAAEAEERARQRREEAVRMDADAQTNLAAKRRECDARLAELETEHQRKILSLKEKQVDAIRRVEQEEQQRCDERRREVRERLDRELEDYRRREEERHDKDRASLQSRLSAQLSAESSAMVAGNTELQTIRTQLQREVESIQLELRRKEEEASRRKSELDILAKNELEASQRHQMEIMRFKSKEVQMQSEEEAIESRLAALRERARREEERYEQDRQDRLQRQRNEESEWDSKRSHHVKSTAAEEAEAVRAQAQIDARTSQLALRQKELATQEEEVKKLEAALANRRTSALDAQQYNKENTETNTNANAGGASGGAKKGTPLDGVPMDIAAKFIEEQKADIKARHAQLMTSRQTYAREKRQLDELRGSPEYESCRAFLRQVKSTLNHQAQVLNQDLDRVKKTGRWLQAQKRRRRNGGGDDCLHGLLDVDDASASECSTLSNVEADIVAAFGDLEASGMWRRQYGGGPIERIHYPRRPSRQAYGGGSRGRRHDWDEGSSADDSFYRRRRHAAAGYPGHLYVGRGAAGVDAMNYGPMSYGAGMIPGGATGPMVRSAGMEDARLYILHRQLSRWQAERDEARERMDKHSSWLRTFKDRMGPSAYNGGAVIPSAINAMQQTASANLDADGAIRVGQGQGGDIVISIRPSGTATVSQPTAQ